MKKILIVDDDPRLRALVAATLGEDFILFQAADGQQAMKVAGIEKPDMVLLDVAMPRMSGFEVCRRLKSEQGTNHIKVMMITGMDSGENMKQGRDAGADAYFIKPFSPLALLNKINEILEGD